MKNGSRNGVGKAVFADGDAYSGQWENDEPHGYGVLI